MAHPVTKPLTESLRDAIYILRERVWIVITVIIIGGTANKFTVLVFKTTTALPYSGIFIELDSAYWDRESERDLRDRLDKKLRMNTT